MDIKHCTLCPRECGIDRTVTAGYCGGSNIIKAARAELHFWEEPCISGKKGSGTVFFSGCTLKCCFCQNYKISAENIGKEISVERLAEIFIELQDKGAENINLVNPTHYVPFIIEALDMVKSRLVIPVVYNSGGYEKTDTIALLDGYVDIYLPDIKYKSSIISKKYSKAENYFEVAAKAIEKMYEQVGEIKYKDNLLKKGVIIRHLVLPGNRKDSIELLDWIAQTFDKDKILVSLMSQYTPFYRSGDYPEINRRVSTFEYNKVLEHAQKLGLNGFMQEKSSAKEEYTPDFDMTGI